MNLLSDLAAFLAARKAELVDVPVLQPADPFLDTAGEGLRGRIFLTENERGETLCLRPEFTIPVCLEHLRSGTRGTKRYAYCGEVFRQRREGGNAFVQAGIEDIGDTNHARADARSLADALALLDAAAPSVRFQVTLGDQAVFEAAVKALGLPRGWRRKLARAFGNKAQLDALIAALGAPRPRARSGLDGDIGAAIAAGDARKLAKIIAARMEDHGYPLAASRAPDEIAARMIEQATLDNARLTRAHIGELRDFLALSTPLAKAGAALRRIARRMDGRAMEVAIDAFEARTQALAAQGVAIGTVVYSAAFGRPLDYYTGLVYEIGPAGKDGAPVIGGGRYDHLLTLLGAKREIPGVGFSVWLDRLHAAKAGGSQ